jgi:uncharacterized protein (TIGR02679 family)
MKTEDHLISNLNVGPGLAAYAAVEQLPDPAGGTRNRLDRRRQLRYDHIWVRTPAPPPTTIGETDLSERDLLWLVTAETLRRGRRAQTIADRAATSGLFRILYEADRTEATTRLGRLVGIESRPEARGALRQWLDGLTTANTRLLAALIEAVPGNAKTWAAEEAPRLITAASTSSTTREQLVADLCTLAAHLPAEGIHLSFLAEEAVGRTHGLDATTTLGRLGVRLAAAIADLSPPTNAAEIRNAWDRVGVWTDRISSQVIGWRLPLHPKHPAASVAAAYQAANEPAVLTLGLLASSEQPLFAAAPTGGVLWIVEGISVLASLADQRAPAPLVCRGGTPSGAVTHLVKAAVQAGWRITVSSDFEPGGLRGAIALLRCAGTAGTPWRLTTADYLAGRSENEPFDHDQVPDTPWDPQLAEAMRHHGRRVSEESRIQQLMRDLRTA